MSRRKILAGLEGEPSHFSPDVQRDARDARPSSADESAHLNEMLKVRRHTLGVGSGGINSHPHLSGIHYDNADARGCGGSLGHAVQRAGGEGGDVHRGGVGGRRERRVRVAGGHALRELWRRPG